MRARAAVLAAGLIVGALRPSPATAQPASGLRPFTDAVNRGDVAAAVALFAPDGRYAGVLVCAPEPCAGRAAIGEALAFEVADRTHHRLLGGGRGELRCDSLAAVADRVVYTASGDDGPDGITSLVLELDADDAPSARVLADVGRVRAWLEDWAASGADGPLTLPPGS